MNCLISDGYKTGFNIIQINNFKYFSSYNNYRSISLIQSIKNLNINEYKFKILRTFIYLNNLIGFITFFFE